MWFYVPEFYTVLYPAYYNAQCNPNSHSLVKTIILSDLNSSSLYFSVAVRASFSIWLRTGRSRIWLLHNIYIRHWRMVTMTDTVRGFFLSFRQQKAIRNTSKDFKKILQHIGKKKRDWWAESAGDIYLLLLKQRRAPVLTWLPTWVC